MKNKDPIDFLKYDHQIHSKEDLAMAGYTDPGWYFWDETWAYCHGPHSTHEGAAKACVEYAKTL